MNIEREIKDAIHPLVWASVHKLVRDSVWKSVDISIGGSFLRICRASFENNGFSSVRFTINEYRYKSYDLK